MNILFGGKNKIKKYRVGDGLNELSNQHLPFVLSYTVLVPIKMDKLKLIKSSYLFN